MTRKVVLIGLIVAILVVGALALLLGNSNPKMSGPLASASPTLSPSPGLTEANRAIVTKLSAELAAKFSTYERPDSQPYFDSLRPYMVPASFGQLVQQNRELASKIPFVYPVKSTAKEVKLEEESNERVLSVVELDSVIPSTGQEYKQTVTISWVIRNKRWEAEKIEQTHSTKNE